MSMVVLRSLSTVLAFVAFISICLWAYSRKRRDDFEQAANLPFADETDTPLAKSAAREESSAHKQSVCCEEKKS